MIKFEVLGTQLHVIFSLWAGSKSWTIPFARSQETTFDAVVVKDTIAKQLGDRMERIRRNAYNTGREDQRKRKARKNVFRSDFEIRTGYGNQ